MTTPKIVQFTYTDHLDGSIPEFSVVVGLRVDTLSGSKIDSTGFMRPDAAFTQYGLTLDSLVADMNGEAVAALSSKTAELDTKTQLLTQTQTALTEKTNELATLTEENVSLSSLLTTATQLKDEALATVASLQAQLTAILGPIVDGVPQVISKYQGKKVLKMHGLLDVVMNYMSTLAATDDVRLAWDDAADWHRTSPFVTALGYMLGLSDQNIDAMFTEAKAIT